MATFHFHAPCHVSIRSLDDLMGFRTFSAKPCDGHFSFILTGHNIPQVCLDTYIYCRCSAVYPSMSFLVDPFRYQGSENRDIITASIASNAYLVAGRHGLFKRIPARDFRDDVGQGLCIYSRIYLNTYMCVYEFDNC